MEEAKYAALNWVSEHLTELADAWEGGLDHFAVTVNITPEGAFDVMATDRARLETVIAGLPLTAAVQETLFRSLADKTPPAVPILLLSSTEGSDISYAQMAAGIYSKIPFSPGGQA